MIYYLASPYTHDEQAIEEIRYDNALAVAAKLTSLGLTVLSPIAYYHQMVPYLNNHGTDFWAFQKHNRLMMDACDVMLVLTLNGWRDSVGVQEEIKYFRHQHKISLLLSEHEIDSELFFLNGMVG